MAAQQSESERAEELVPEAPQAEALAGPTQPNSWLARAAGSCRRNAAHDRTAAALPPSTPPLSATAGHVALPADMWTWSCVSHSKPALSKLSPLRKLKMTRHAPAAGSKTSACTCAAAERSIGCTARGGRAGCGEAAEAGAAEAAKALKAGEAAEAARAREKERAHTVPSKESGRGSIGYLPICEKSSHTVLSSSLSPPTFSEVYACACVVSPLRGARGEGVEGEGGRGGG